MSLRVKYWLSVCIIIAVALRVCAVWSVVAGLVLSVTVSDSLGYAPVLSGEKRGTFTLSGPVCLYICAPICPPCVCKMDIHTLWKSVCVGHKEMIVCVRERKRNRQPLFSRAGSETAGRDNNRSCYILVVSLISAWGWGLARARARADSWLHCPALPTGARHDISWILVI